jgi:hypothetical protein
VKSGFCIGFIILSLWRFPLKILHDHILCHVAHPNVRLFITHGGLLSMQEAINRGVPLLGIPIFGDQSLNMRKAVTAGYGVMVEYNNVSEESLTWAIREIIENPRYVIYLHYYYYYCYYYYYYHHHHHHHHYYFMTAILTNILFILEIINLKCSIYWILRSVSIREIVFTITYTRLIILEYKNFQIFH